jgi:hypothetical protein
VQHQVDASYTSVLMIPSSDISFKPSDARTAEWAMNENLANMLQLASEQALVLNPKKFVALLLGTRQQKEKVMRLSFEVVSDGITFERRICC